MTGSTTPHLLGLQKAMVLLLLLLIGVSVPAFGQGCSLQLSGSIRSFDRCLPLDHLGSNANLMWTVSGNGQQISWGLNTTTDGYVGVGFPTEDDDNVMVGTNAFILQPCDGCATGAQLYQIYMSGTASGNMEPSNTIPTTGIEAQAGPDDWLVATFTTPPVTTVESMMVIYAGGGVYKNGAIRQHSKYAEVTINLLTGDIDDPEYWDKQISSLIAAHIWLLIVGWGFLAPLGIVIARSLKSKDPMWFQLHRAIMTLGLVLGIVGLALGFVVAGGWEGIFTAHRNIGLASIILGFLQATAWVLRPKLSSGLRRGWNLWHWWEGRAAIVLGVANIYYGLCKIIDVGAWSWGVYTAVFAIICLIPIAKESLQYLQLPPPALMKKEDYTSWRPTLTGVDVELPYKQRTNGVTNGVDGHGKGPLAGPPTGAAIA